MLVSASSKTSFTRCVCSHVGRLLACPHMHPRRTAGGSHDRIVLGSGTADGRTRDQQLQLFAPVHEALEAVKANEYAKRVIAYSP